MRFVASIALVLVGCASSAPAPAPSTSNGAASQSGGESEACGADGRAPCADLFGSLPSQTPARSASPPAPSIEGVPLPASRRDATVTTNVPALAAPQAAYTRLLALSLVPDAGASLDTALAQLTQRIQLSAEAVQALRTSCESVVVADRSLSVACGTMLSDALDLLGSRIATLHVPMPAELRSATDPADAEAQAELQRRFDEGLTSVLARQAHDIFCTAAAGYQGVLSEDPTAARATQQLSLYGGAFLASCP